MSSVVRSAFQRPGQSALLTLEPTGTEEPPRRTPRLFHVHHGRAAPAEDLTTTLFPPLTVGDALRRLGMTSLQGLCARRGMTGGRSLEDKRAALREAYGNNWRALLDDTRRTDLVELLRAPHVLGRIVYCMPPMGRMTRTQLLANARPLFEGRSVPPDFMPMLTQTVPAPSEDGGEDALLAGLTDQWSRPRALTRLFKLTGLTVPQRLQTPRFQELLHRLKVMGVGVQLEDGTECTVDTPSPGISARVRLRRAAVLPDIPETETRTTSVVIVPGATPGSTPAPSGAPYELALLRLQFLTAAPSMDRAHQPEWPEAYLTASVRGLSLPEASLRLLRLAAATFVRGGHDPLSIFALLRMRCAPDELGPLCEAFARLNATQKPFTDAVLKETGFASPAANERTLGALDDLFA